MVYFLLEIFSRINDPSILNLCFGAYALARFFLAMLASFFSLPLDRASFRLSSLDSNWALGV